MCGISCFISKSDEGLEVINKLTESLKHRGNDNITVKQIDNVYLGHNRLSINDLSESGNQPFEYNGKHSIVNGEIWNHKQLREELEVNFKSNSDCEVVLPLYEKNQLKKLDGMFSFIIYDNGKVVISRDWVGKLPLYYAEDDKGVYLTSEIKALKEVTETRDIKFIPRSSLVTIDTKTFTIETENDYYGWISNVQDKPKSHDEVAKKTYELLDNAVKKRLISDVPIATLNSGGIDSSVITYLLSKYIDGIKCYTVKFDEESPDLKHARILADHLGIELVEIEVPRDPEEIKERFSIVNKVIEYPSSIQTQCGIMTSYIMEQIAKDGYKVVFSGEGSDESAGSYSRMQMFKNKPDWCDLKKAMFEKQYYGNLLRGNNIGMYFGTIEMRTPFFDRDYVDYVCNLGSEYTYGKGQQRKQHLAKAFEGKIPDAILNRKKETFQAGTCFQKWFEETILSDKKVNFKNRKKMYHAICDDIDRQLRFDVLKVRKEINTSNMISDLFE